MSAKHPDVGFGGITTLVAAEWAKLSDEEKAAYRARQRRTTTATSERGG